MKKSISANERLQLIGLVTLAKRHNQLLRDLCAAVAEIIGETGDYDMGHAADAVYEAYDIDPFLAKLKITVEG